ncbi:uncharacterized protein ACB058_018922 [Synchiropus picturatus]
MSETTGPASGQSWASSDDSEEEARKLEPMSTSWNELSIIERVGLNSVEMSEADLEAAFSQIAMAFRCDQYTLKQRLQAEEHARNLAEENIQLELSRGRETLETLKGLCLDSKRSKILQRLELSLDILAGTVERISSTAEVLGAVHQEARVSRAVELMVAHVENLRRSHHRHKTELQEAQKTIQRQNSCRNITRNSDSPDLLDSDTVKENFKPNCSRRRVSVSLLPNQIQEKVKQNPKKPPTTDGSACASVSSCPTESSVPAEALRHRHRNKSTLAKRKADKDQAARHVPVATAASVWKRPPLSLLVFSLLVGMTLELIQKSLCGGCLLLCLNGAALQEKARHRSSQGLSGRRAGGRRLSSQASVDGLEQRPAPTAALLRPVLERRCQVAGVWARVEPLQFVAAEYWLQERAFSEAQLELDGADPGWMRDNAPQRLAGISSSLGSHGAERRRAQDVTTMRPVTRLPRLSSITPAVWGQLTLASNTLKIDTYSGCSWLR